MTGKNWTGNPAEKYESEYVLEGQVIAGFFAQMRE
jgi:hypothetical protein